MTGQEYEFSNEFAEDEEKIFAREGPSIIAFLMEGKPDAEKRLDLYLSNLVSYIHQVQSGRARAYRKDVVIGRLQALYYFYYQSETLVLQVLKRRDVQDQDAAQNKAAVRENAAIQEKSTGSWWSNLWQ